MTFSSKHSPSHSARNEHRQTDSSAVVPQPAQITVLPSPGAWVSNGRLKGYITLCMNEKQHCLCRRLHTGELSLVLLSLYKTKSNAKAYFTFRSGSGLELQCRNGAAPAQVSSHQEGNLAHKCSGISVALICWHHLCWVHIASNKHAFPAFSLCSK